MALAPEWMSYTKDSSSSQGSRVLGRERERGGTKYGRQLSHNNFSYSPSQTSSYTLDSDRDGSHVPFACSVSSPPAPPQSFSILGESRVLNRSKSSPGFASPKSNKSKKSPPDRLERNFPTYNSIKPKPKQKPLVNPPSYYKSQSQPNLFNNEKTVTWHQPKSSMPPPATHATSAMHPPAVPPSISPPPQTASGAPVIDKLKHLVPTSKPVRPRGVVGPPLPLAKKAPPSMSSVHAMPPPVAPPSASSTGIVSTQPAILATYFRKATSEPSLIHHKAQGSDAAPVHSARRLDAATKKARAMEAEKAQSQLLKEAADAKMPKRKNFFQHIIEREEQGPLLDEELPIGIDSTSTPTTVETETTEPETQAAYSPSVTPPPRTPPNATSSPVGLRSPLPADMELEERFMRTLGWVPDEEDPVAILDEEEIADALHSKNKRGHDTEPDTKHNTEPDTKPDTKPDTDL